MQAAQSLLYPATAHPDWHLQGSAPCQKPIYKLLPTSLERLPVRSSAHGAILQLQTKVSPGTVVSFTTTYNLSQLWAARPAFACALSQPQQPSQVEKPGSLQANTAQASGLKRALPHRTLPSPLSLRHTIVPSTLTTTTLQARSPAHGAAGRPLHPPQQICLQDKAACQKTPGNTLQGATARCEAAQQQRPAWPAELQRSGPGSRPAGASFPCRLLVGTGLLADGAGGPAGQPLVQAGCVVLVPAGQRAQQGASLVVLQADRTPGLAVPVLIVLGPHHQRGDGLDDLGRSTCTAMQLSKAAAWPELAVAGLSDERCLGL